MAKLVVYTSLSTLVSNSFLIRDKLFIANLRFTSHSLIFNRVIDCPCGKQIWISKILNGDSFNRFDRVFRFNFRSKFLIMRSFRQSSLRFLILSKYFKCTYKVNLVSFSTYKLLQVQSHIIDSAQAFQNGQKQVQLFVIHIVIPTNGWQCTFRMKQITCW